MVFSLTNLYISTTSWYIFVVFSLYLRVIPSMFTVTPVVTVIRIEQVNFILESLLKECELVSKASFKINNLLIQLKIHGSKYFLDL